MCNELPLDNLIMCADDMIKDVDVIGIYKGEGKPTDVKNSYVHLLMKL